MIYVVLGMHKSGTTLVAQMLHKSGINMGNFDESVGYDSGNQFERKETQRLNMAMLQCGYDLSLNVISPLNEEKLSKDYYAKIRILIEDLCVTFEDWGFKDPRTCLTYPAWQRCLPTHCIIFVYRSPFEVWLHYQRECSRFNWIRKIKNGWKAITAWYVYNKQALEYLEKQENESIIIDYSKLMHGNMEFKLLEKFLNLKIHDCRKDSLYRAKVKQSILYKGIVWVQKHFILRDIEALFFQMKKNSPPIKTCSLASNVF